MAVKPLKIVRQKTCLAMLASLTLGFNVIPGYARAESPNNASARCKALESADLSRLLDAPTQIIDTKLIDMAGRSPAYCQVNGYVAPSVGFLIRMPAENWNDKLIEMGCGGHCGSTDHIRQCDNALRRGYACIVTDDGHRATGNQAMWSYNNWQGQIDYFVRAAHVTALAGKAIAEHFYKEAPKRAYFVGCSAGGREAMMEAQRFPWDFNGIISGAPSLSQTQIRMNLLWGARAMHDAAGALILRKSDLELLHKSAVAKCDLNDGVKDGLIGDPRKCGFDAAELLCTAGRTTQCLSAQQIESANKIYHGPVTSTGGSIQPPGAMKGSELNWLDYFGGNVSEFVQETFRYFAFNPSPGAAWKVEDFDFERDYKRFGLADGMYAAVNPDLRRFNDAGGKLLSYAGWNDAAGMPLPLIDYYEGVEKIMGPGPTKDFFRLFLIPGMNHCTGGEGAFDVDYLTYLEAWVEKREAPEELTGFHVSIDGAKDARELIEQRLEFPLDPATIEFSRPFFPYPQLTKYRGRGDPNNAASFGPANP
jgi:hypothetical protein